MKKIVAIGGGEMGRPKENGGFYPFETLEIDKKIIELSNKKHPKILFLPTASSDSQSYFDVVSKYYGEKLDCKVDILNLTRDKPLKSEIEKKILNSDIIYVGGGNTLKMMKIWRSVGVDKILKEAHDKGIVLSGLSAGAICWFTFGNSDSMKFTNSNTSLIKVKGLNFIEGLLCPHYDTEIERKEDLKKMMKKTPKIIAIAIDECCAIEIVDEKYKIISSKETANAYKIYWKKNQFFEEIIEKSEKYKDLNKLLSK